MVEQGTHKPLVGSSTLPPGTSFFVWEHTYTCCDLGPGGSITGRPLICPAVWRSIVDVIRTRRAAMRRGRWWRAARWPPWRKRAHRSGSLSGGNTPAEFWHGLRDRAAPTPSVGVGREFNSPPWHQLHRGARLALSVELPRTLSMLVGTP